MPHNINRFRRRFFGSAAMTLAAGHLEAPQAFAAAVIDVDAF
jgi:hypothetical protein